MTTTRRQQARDQDRKQLQEVKPLEFRDLRQPASWPRVGASYRTNPTFSHQGLFTVTKVTDGMVTYHWLADSCSVGPAILCEAPAWLFAAMAEREEVKPDGAELADLRRQVTELADVLAMILRGQEAREAIPSGVRVAGYGALAKVGGRGLGDVLREFEEGGTQDAY